MKYVGFRNRRESNWVKCLTFPACNRTYGYKREWYEVTMPVGFEGIMLQGCLNYKEYLEFLYGDYMTLPAEEERKSHPVSEIIFNEELILEEEGGNNR